MRRGRQIKTSKRMARLLRHRPWDGGLTVEDDGFVVVDELLEVLGITFDELKEVVDSGSKKRFEFDDTEKKIRAIYGHSIDVDIGYEKVVPPDVLYHGTATCSVDKILDEGLKSMSRLYVHLSVDVKTAEKVGKRRGESVVLVVDSCMMYSDGLKFYVTQNGVYLTDYVPAKYITMCDDNE